MDVAERIFADPSLPTPALVYAEGAVLEALELLRGALAAHLRGPLSILFAIKSCYRVPVLRCLARAGVGAELMSPLELELALAAGFRGESLLANGLGRPAALLAALCRHGGRLVIDCATDLETLLAVVADGAPPARPVRVGLRLALDLAGFATPYARRPHKLGLAPGSADYEHVLALATSRPELVLDLLHVHLASNETDGAVYRHAIGELARARDDIERRRPGVTIRTIDLGGGFAALGPATAAPLSALFDDLGAAFAERFGALELALEPGRFLVDGAAWALATVTAVKRRGDLTFLIVDAPTSTLMPYQEATYALARPAGGVGRHRVAVVDGITSLSSVLIHETRLERLPEVGERLLLANCGAYTSALAQFWVYDPIPVYFLDRQGTLTPDLTPDAIAEARRLLLGIG